MKIQTDCGELEAMAWHIGRHISMTMPGENGAYFRVDGKPVAEIYQALQTTGMHAVEVDDNPRHYVNMLITVNDEGCMLKVNDARPVMLDREAHLELLAVYETAFTQATKGLDEMHEDEERCKYGLPPRE